MPVPAMLASVRLDLAEALASSTAMGLKPAPKAKPKARSQAWPKGSRWYAKAAAADRATEARSYQRAPRAKSARANEQATEYARWLARRNGVELPEHSEGSVTWELCEHGLRPRSVALYESRVNQWGDRQGRGSLVVALALPNWDAAWEVVEDLSEPESALPLAA